MPRVLFAAHACYLDDSSGAAVASRALMEMLARGGSAVEVLCGASLDLDRELDLGAWLQSRGHAVAADVPETWTLDPAGEPVMSPSHYRLCARGVPITVQRGPTTRPHHPGPAEVAEFLTLLDAVARRLRPEVVLTYGGGPLGRAIPGRAAGLGAAAVFALHNLSYRDPDAFRGYDATLVPSAYAAEHYRATLGLRCAAIPCAVDFERALAVDPTPRYLTFVNPSPEKGVWAFARIAEVLGRARPEIPVLVVESRGTEASVAACGLELRGLGTVSFHPHTGDPRRFWRVTRALLMPSLWEESQGLAAVEAMLNGIPVVASDRGALPETIGDAGCLLPLPGRLTPATAEAPTAEEVAPWVAAVVRLWDDPAHARDLARRAADRARLWSPEALWSRYDAFFAALGRR